MNEVPPWKGAWALVRGKHYTEWVGAIKQLKREKRHRAALLLLAECQQAALQDSPSRPAPWYFEQEAIIQRKEGRPWAEKAALERYLRSAEQPHPRIVERYAKLTGQWTG